jgi:hypothetical protein
MLEFLIDFCTGIVSVLAITQQHKGNNANGRATAG